VPKLNITDQVKKAQEAADALPAKSKSAAEVKDSYQNFSAKFGIGTDNISSVGTYGFNPISRNRVLLEWMHRGDWLSGVAVDVMADDMTRGGVSIVGDMPPDQIKAIEEEATTYGVWPGINRTIKWSRLYGGAVGVLMVDGQAMQTPLNLDRVGKGQFRGVYPLDMWMLYPSFNDLVTELGPFMGLPKFYTVQVNAPAFVGKKIHYTRCIRLIGTEMPYQQSLVDNLWGASVLERLNDRLLAFNSCTTGAAQLVFKAYLRTYKIKDLRMLVAQGGGAMDKLIAYINMMNHFQGPEGTTLMDAEDEFEGIVHNAFSGLSEVLQDFGQQLAGALGIPLVRLFGQSPKGLNATGESDLKMYYDNILSRQVSVLKVPVTKIYRMLAQSLGFKVPDGFGITFNNLWQMDDKTKAEVAGSITETVTKAQEAGLVTQQTAMKELQQSSSVTGVWSNITDEDIAAAEEQLPPGPVEAAETVQENLEAQGNNEEKNGAPPKAKDAARRNGHSRFRDTTALANKLAWHHGLQVVIENPQGSIRRGYGWSVSMPADYGYIRAVEGADGDKLDCYVGPSPESDQVFIVDQKNLKTGEYDEAKVCLGYHTKEAAVEDYVLGYTDGTGPQRIMNVSHMHMAEFKEWMATADLKKPVALAQK
jgi:phage-related protein (TIGR01555 family)